MTKYKKLKKNLNKNVENSLKAPNKVKKNIKNIIVLKMLKVV